jgi:hypothetical protein
MAKSTTDLPNDAGVVGVDYGTLLRRAVVVRLGDGQQLGSGVSAYAHSVLDQALPGGKPLPRRPQLAQPSKSADDSASRSRRLRIQSPAFLVRHKGLT